MGARISVVPLIELRLHGDGAFEDIDIQKAVLAMGEHRWRLATLPGGMTSGKPSICLGIELEPGKWVVAETSAAALIVAARAIEAAFPDALE